MTIRRWLTVASAAGLLAGVGACKDNTGAPRGSDSTTPGSTSSRPEGRSGPTLPRARADAGMDSSSGTSGSVSGSSSQTTSGASSGSNADQTAPATGTTPGDKGQTPSNGSPTDSKH